LSSKTAQIFSMFGGGVVAQADMTARQSVPNNAEPAREPALLPLTGFIDSRCMPLKALMI